MHNAAEIAAAMSAAGCTSDQIATALGRLQGSHEAQLRRERNRRHYENRVLNRLNSPSYDRLNASENRLKSSELEPRIRVGVHNLALSLESKEEREEREDKSSLRSDSSKTDFDLLGVEEPKPKPKPKAKRDTSAADAVVDDFLDRWAQLASQHRLAGCRAVTNPRQARILARANDLTGVLGFVSVKAGFDDLFARIRGSPFLLGNGSGRPWKCDLDWVTTESNFIKIMEGKYAKAEGQSPTPNGFQPYR